MTDKPLDILITCKGVRRGAPRLTGAYDLKIRAGCSATTSDWSFEAGLDEVTSPVVQRPLDHLFYNPNINDSDSTAPYDVPEWVPLTPTIDKILNDNSWTWGTWLAIAAAFTAILVCISFILFLYIRSGAWRAAVRGGGALLLAQQLQGDAKTNKEDPEKEKDKKLTKDEPN